MFSKGKNRLSVLQRGIAVRQTHEGLYQLYVPVHKNSIAMLCEGSLRDIDGYLVGFRDFVMSHFEACFEREAAVDEVIRIVSGPNRLEFPQCPFYEGEDGDLDEDEDEDEYRPGSGGRS